MEQVSVIISLDRYQELLTKEDMLVKGNNISAEVKATTLNSVEEDINKGSTETSVKDKPTTHEYEGNPYVKLFDSKIKAGDMLDKFIAHPKLGPKFKELFDKTTYEALSKVWLPVVVFQAQYGVPEGEKYVRMKEEFDSQFKPV